MTSWTLPAICRRPIPASSAPWPCPSRASRPHVRARRLATVSASLTRWRPCDEAGPPPPPPRRAARRTPPRWWSAASPMAPGTGISNGTTHARHPWSPPSWGPPPVAPPLKPHPSDRDDKHHRGRRPPPPPRGLDRVLVRLACVASILTLVLALRVQPEFGHALEPRHAFRAYLLAHARDINDVRVPLDVIPVDQLNRTSFFSRMYRGERFIVAGAAAQLRRARRWVGPEGDAYLPRRRRRRRGFRGTERGRSLRRFRARMEEGGDDARRVSGRARDESRDERAESFASVSRRGGHPRGALGRRAALRFRGFFGPVRR